MAAIKGSSYYYKTNTGGVSSVVGYESSSRRVMRTAFTVNDSATKLTVKMKMSAGDVSYRNCQVYMAVSTNSSAYVNHTGTDGTFLGSWSGTATKEATITGLELKPGTQYYLWFYHYDDKYAWLYAYNDNLTLTASDPIYYTITYNPGTHGSGTIDAGSQKYGAAFTLTSSTYSRTGYTQTGWSLDTEDGSAEYSIGQSFPAGSSFSRSCTLYPTWAANKYTITFNANGGTLPNGYTSYATGSDPSVAYNSSNYSIMDWMVPTRTGYRFLGYYTATSGGTQVYDASGVCVAGSYWNSNKQWIYTSNLTVYAQWERIQYTISFDANGGSVSPTAQTIGYPDGNYMNFPAPSNPGKKFMGWFADIQNNGPIAMGYDYRYTDKLNVGFEAYREDWTYWTGNDEVFISCTNGGGWNLFVNGSNGKLCSDIWDAGQNKYNTPYDMFDLKTLSPGWHRFDFVFGNSKVYYYIDDQEIAVSNTFSGNIGIGGATSSQMWLGAEASGGAAHDGAIFQGLIRNLRILNDTWTDRETGVFAIPNQNVTLYADWESSSTMYIRVNGEWKRGNTGIKLAGQWIGFEGVPSSVIMENLDTAFGFKLNNNGYFENTNKNINTTAANCKLTITLVTEQELIIQYNQSSEKNYDYGVFSKLNTPLNTGYNSDISGNNIAHRLYGISGTGTLSYGVLQPGTYTIYVKYRKDGSSHGGSDTLQFRVLNIDNSGPTVWEPMYDCMMQYDCDCECDDCLYDCDCECSDCIYDCDCDCAYDDCDTGDCWRDCDCVGYECECTDCIYDCDCSYEDCWWECECNDCGWDECYDCIYDCFYDCDCGYDECECFECECYDCSGYDCWQTECWYDCDCDCRQYECECNECGYDECMDCDCECSDCYWKECTPR